MGNINLWISIEENIVESNFFHMIEFVYYAELDNFDDVKFLNDGWDKFEFIDIVYNTYFIILDKC